MTYNFQTVPSVIIKECSLGSVDIIKHKDHFTLYNNGDRWMIFNENSDKEIKELYSSYDIAYGDVLVSGLGFGILALWLCNKPEVSSVTVVEISKDVIDIFKKNNMVPNKLKIINDSMITYDTDKEYDALLLDHYERQNFDWRLKDINSICSRIKHKHFWAWSLEDIYIFKMYSNKIKENGIDIHNILKESSTNFIDLWHEFIDTFLPEESQLKDLPNETIKEYLYLYFNRQD